MNIDDKDEILIEHYMVWSHHNENRWVFKIMLNLTSVAYNGENKERDSKKENGNDYVGRAVHGKKIDVKIQQKVHANSE